MAKGHSLGSDPNRLLALFAAAGVGDRGNCHHVDPRKVAAVDVLTVVPLLLGEVRILRDRALDLDLLADQRLELIAVAPQPVGVLRLTHLLLFDNPPGGIARRTARPD